MGWLDCLQLTPPLPPTHLIHEKKAGSIVFGVVGEGGGVTFQSARQLISNKRYEKSKAKILGKTSPRSQADKK